MTSSAENPTLKTQTRFIICYTFCAITAMNINEVIKSPGVRYGPGIQFAGPGRRSFSDFDREWFLHKLEQSLSDKLVFAEYEKRSHHNFMLRKKGKHYFLESRKLTYFEQRQLQQKNLYFHGLGFGWVGGKVGGLLGGRIN